MSESTNNATVTDSLTVAAERAAFEAWYTQHDASAAMSARVVARSSSGSYVLMQVHQAWLVWKARAEFAARESAALSVALAQLEEERARNLAAQAMPKVAGYLSKTGHGSYFRETITPALAGLEWCGTPMWRPVAFVDAAPHLAIIPGADPK